MRRFMKKFTGAQQSSVLWLSGEKTWIRDLYIKSKGPVGRRVQSISSYARMYLKVCDLLKPIDAT